MLINKKKNSYNIDELLNILQNMQKGIHTCLFFILYNVYQDKYYLDYTTDTIIFYH